MTTFLSLFCLLSTFLFSTIVASPLEKKVLSLEGNLLATKSKRTTHLLEECLFVSVEEASYVYKSQGTDDVCGLYIVSRPDQRIEVSIDFLRVNCDSGGLITLLDGWEMGGEVFPPLEEDQLDSRVTNFCGVVQKRLVLTSTNAATLLYKLPSAGDIFRISVKYRMNPKPCNILLTSDSEVVTLRNHGLRRNCTLATAFPANFKILQLSVGVESKFRKFAHQNVHSRFLDRCHKRGYSDMVLIGGANGLDTRSMHVQELICGLDSNPRMAPARILCDVASVRLVSSGAFVNSVTVAVEPLVSLEELPTLMCQQYDVE